MKRLYPVEITMLLVLALFLASGVSAVQTQEELAEKVVRLHVLANSDSEEDQALKLQVRDAVLEKATERLSGTESREATIQRLYQMLPELQQTAEDTVQAEGYAYLMDYVGERMASMDETVPFYDDRAAENWQTLINDYIRGYIADLGCEMH